MITQSTVQKKLPLSLGLLAFGLALIAHASIVLFVLQKGDPCNNNPGCMAGSGTQYFIALISIPTMLVMLLTTVVSLFRQRSGFRKILGINFAISVLPFIVLKILLAFFVSN
ncbi:MAG: hypothetical protein AAF438_20270 [Pseudomonadota bacterium]